MVERITVQESSYVEVSESVKCERILPLNCCQDCAPKNEMPVQNPYASRIKSDLYSTACKASGRQHPASEVTFPA